ncbi:phosphatidylinositol-glycan biosynthesis class S protein, partial [Linnemannia elongata]
TRRMVILSVWAVVLLGLPLWWKTTRVYRAELPYDSIDQWNQTIRQLLDTNEDTQGVRKVHDQLKTVKYAPGYQLTFSLFSGDASNGVREWKMQEVIHAYLAPFIKTMSTVSKFTIESQIQHYASLAFTPQMDYSSQEHYLTPDALPNFINAAEWSLASTVSSLPSLNFLTYVPKPSESPLVIKTGPGASKSSTNSFLIPRWGGVAILNRDIDRTKRSEEYPEVITVQDLEPVMRVFLTQLRDLMGVTDLSTTTQPSSSFPIVFHKSLNEAPTTWELDNLLRRRSAENLVDSLATISSLARLVRKTPNMVVLDHIQKDVTEALRDIGRSCEHLSRQEYVEALAASRDGLVKSETAFFDPTMVSMLYFPDEHKYAIYMPLFVPISVPLLMSLLREVKRLKEKKKQAQMDKDSQGHDDHDIQHDKQE